MENYRQHFFKLLSITILLNSIISFGQNEKEAINNKSFKELSKLFYKHTNDTTKAIKIANTYLTKAKAINDSIKIADGFYFLTVLGNENELLNLNDSIIHYTKNLKNNKHYPLLAYVNKGDHYYLKRNFDLSLENYLIANKYSDNNLSLKYELKHKLSLLKTRYGDKKAGLILSKEVLLYSKKENYNKKYPSYYCQVLFALANSFLKNKQIDSSHYYAKIGFNKSLETNNKIYENYFRLLEGVIEFNKNNYKNSIDSITKYIKSFKRHNDLPNLAYANHYLGLSYFKLNNIKYLSHFKKVDSIFQKTQDLHPDLRSSYEYIIDYYRSKGNLKKELEYVKKLIDLDKVIYTNYSKIGLSLIKKYDTPILLQEKSQIIENLKNNSLRKKYYLIITCLVVLILIYLVFYQNKKKKLYKQKFEEIITSTSTSTSTSTLHKNEQISIPKDIIKNILKELDSFEKKEEYISNSITLSYLAKKFNTNTNYLSKIINHYRDNSFSNYLNNLRINFITRKLKEDKTLRKYTIKAISEEAGYNNSESFSKAFYKIKGIKPSYFIKELNKIDF